MKYLENYLKKEGYTTLNYFGSLGVSGGNCITNLGQDPCFFDSSFLTILKVTGSDKQSYLNGQTSNDLLKLSVGNGQYSSLNSPKGKTISLLTIYRTEDAFYILYPRLAHERLLEQLNLYLFTEDVILEEVSYFSSFTFPGESSIKRISEYYGLDIPEPPRNQVFKREDQFIFVGNILNVPAVTVMSSNENSLKIPNGFKPICAHFLEKQRILNLYPMPQTEYEFEKTLTPELDQDEIISYSKGCFVGQEIFARIRTYGKTNRILCAIMFPEGSTQSLKGMEIEVNGNTRGAITSDIHDGNCTYALGYIPTAYKVIGKEVKVGSFIGKIVA